MRKSLIMALIALLVGLPSIGAWPGEVRAEDYAFTGGGNGDPATPYIILKAEDLDHVRDDLEASYRLGTDIDLSAFGDWTPIGSSIGGKGFEGIFDGAGYTINGMTIDSGADQIGMFGYVHKDDTIIRNVRLTNVDVHSTNEHANVGGLVGLINHALIENSSVTGEIDGSVFSAGGLVGQAATAANLNRNHSSVKVNVTGGNASVGGLAGGITSDATLERSYATGDVSLSGGGHAGGLVGQLGGAMTDSYATGKVTGDGHVNIGGLVGNISLGSIINSYTTGKVIPGTGSAGGLIGGISFGATITVTGTYWNADANSSGLPSFGWEAGRDEAVSQALMMQGATYAGWWDDPAIWGIQEGTGYPYLKAFAPAVKVDSLSPAYSLQPGFNEITIAGSIRDGSSGEPLEVGYIIRNEANVTVTSDVYAISATGEDQAFHFTTTLNEADYPEGAYTLTVVWEDTVAAYEQPEPMTFFVDRTPPEIALTGSDTIVLQAGDTFIDPGATASDRGIDLSGSIDTIGAVDTSLAGTYMLTYEVTDSVGHATTKTRTVKVYNSLFPMLILKGSYTMEVEVGSAFTDPGATASDERDDDMTDRIVVSGTVNTARVGTYPIEYKVTNSLGNQASTTRTVQVVDRTPPVLTLLGANPMRIEVGSTFTDPGAIAEDVGDDDLSDEITVTGAVYANRVGTYTLTYSVQDHAGNAAADAVRTVNVVSSSSDEGGGRTGPTGPAGPADGDPSGETTGEDDSEVPPALSPECPFTDVKGHWSESAVCEAAELGVVAGVSAHAFLPDAAVTRTEFAAMLMRALRIGIDEEASPVPFSDRALIPKWADPAIRTAVAMGILSGYADGTLRPEQTVNRSEMAVMVAKAMKWQAVRATNAHFADDASIPEWAKGYVEAARQRGILSGRDGHRFAPAETATRAEAAVVIVRLRELLQ